MSSPDPPCTIRAATEADVGHLVECIRGLARYERLEHELVATESSIRESLFGETPRAEALLALAGGAPVGFAVFFHNFSTFLGRHGLYLEDIFVFPEHRGRGIGRKLLESVARIAVERGCGRMEWIALDWNESAIGFYERIGARAMSEWRLFRLTGEPLARLGGS